jgi:hypothetical protein
VHHIHATTLPQNSKKTKHKNYYAIFKEEAKKNLLIVSPPFSLIGALRKKMERNKQADTATPSKRHDLELVFFLSCLLFFFSV